MPEEDKNSEEWSDNLLPRTPKNEGAFMPADGSNQPAEVRPIGTPEPNLKPKKSHKGLIISLIVLVVLVALVVSYLMFIPKYVISGKITEQYTIVDYLDKSMEMSMDSEKYKEGKGVADIVISVGGKDVKSDADGNYKLEGFKRLKKELEINVQPSNRFEAIEKFKINFKTDFISILQSEIFNKDIKLTLTKAEKEKNWNDISVIAVVDDLKKAETKYYNTHKSYTSKLNTLIKQDKYLVDDFKLKSFLHEGTDAYGIKIELNDKNNYVIKGYLSNGDIFQCDKKECQKIKK